LFETKEQGARQSKMKHSTGKDLSGVAVLALAAVATVGTGCLSTQQSAIQAPLLHGYFVTQPWMEGTQNDAMVQATASSTIPMSSYTFASTKDGKSYTGTLVGTSPFAATKTGATIPVVVVPIKITIGSAVFDPNAPNTCDGNISVVNRFTQSPLVQSSPLTFNGVSVGTTQYVNGFLRAEFWNEIGGSAAYQNTLSPVTFATEVSVTATVPSQASTYSTGCTEVGIVSYNWLSSYLTSEISSLTKSGVVGPTKFVVFLVKNIVQSTASPPTTSGCCILGFHSAQGSPVQTYGVMDWDTTGDFGAGTDAAIASHEIAEWMNDPLGSNPTPAWGNVGQVSGCQSNFEVGDPLSGTVMPAITLSGKAYHMQELGFFSWYFNKNGVASLGAGGKFSGNGTFKGPAKACPPGGTN
jgi:hypothetical protein